MADERPHRDVDAQPATAAHSTRPPRLRPRHLVLLGLILLLATGLRLYRLGSQALWADEFLSLEQSAGWGFAHEDLPSGVVIERLPDLTTLRAARPWTDIWSSLREDAHPPLYLVLLRGWREVFVPLNDEPGELGLEAVLRGLSVVASLASILLLFDVAWRLHGPRYGAAPALWACALMAIAGPQIQFAQEARSYALLTAFGLGACAALVRLEQDGPRWSRALALGGCVLAMALTHYAAVGAIAAAAIYAGVRLRGPALKQAGLAFALAAALFVVTWGPFLHAQHADQTKPAWNSYDDPEHVRSTLERLAMLPIRFLNEPMRSSRGTALLAAGGYVVCLLMLRRRPDLLLWVLWAGGVIAAAAIVDLLRSSDYLQVLRYTLLAAPAAYAIIAALLVHARPALLRHAFPVVAAMSCVISLPRAYQFYTPAKPEWRELTGYVQRLSGRDDGIVFLGDPREADVLRAVALGYAQYLSPLPRPFVFLTGRPNERVEQRLAQCTGIWVVTRKRPREWVSMFPAFEPETVVYDPEMPHVYRLRPRDDFTPADSAIPATLAPTDQPATAPAAEREL
jgi:uncharacterized membrane protein